jgi:hypothetical protein
MQQPEVLRRDLFDDKGELKLEATRSRSTSELREAGGADAAFRAKIGFNENRSGKKLPCLQGIYQGNSMI